MEAGLEAGGLGCLTPFQAVPKLRIHNLVRGPMYVSDWPKMPNMVSRPKLGGNSTFLRHGPLGQGILSFALTCPKTILHALWSCREVDVVWSNVEL